MMRLAEGMNDPAARLELLDIATAFQRLADRSAAIVAHSIVAHSRDVSTGNQPSGNQPSS